MNKEIKERLRTNYTIRKADPLDGEPENQNPVPGKEKNEKPSSRGSSFARYYFFILVLLILVALIWDIAENVRLANSPAFVRRSSLGQKSLRGNGNGNFSRKYLFFTASLRDSSKDIEDITVLSGRLQKP